MSSLIFVVTTPFVGVAMALLYGDLVAAETEAAPAMAGDRRSPG